MKRKLFGFLSLALALPFLLTFMVLATETVTNKSQQQQGFQDLQLDQGKSMKLDGEWLFYWKEWIPAQHLPSKINDSNKIKVPSEWTNVELEKYGWATYYVRIHVEPSKDIYGLKIGPAPSAYTLYINGELKLVNGVIGKDKQSETPSLATNVVYFTTEKDYVDIVIHMSNYHFRTGGFWTSFELGHANAIKTKHVQTIIFQAIMFGGLLIFSIYHLGQFIYRKVDKLPLIFGLFCFVLSIRVLITNERFFLYFTPSISTEVLVTVEYICYYLAIPLFYDFLAKLFPNEMNRTFGSILWVISLGFSVMTMVTPASVFTQTIVLFNASALVAAVYFIYVMILAFINRREGGLILLVCGCFFILSTVHDILMVFGVVSNGPELSALGIFVFVFSQAYVTSTKFTLALVENEEMKKELTEVNKTLEVKVEKRTAQLELMNQRLIAMNKKLEELSMIDGLTQIPNRRMFDETLSHEWLNAIENNRPISLILLDIDYFKRYNDNYGHTAGDFCLKQVAKCLSETIREHECLVARYGGEEFAIIVPFETTQAVYLLAEKCRKIVEQQSIPHEYSEIASVVTVSVGCATLKPNEKLVQQTIISAADRALYSAKNTGRNRTCIWH